MPSDPTPWISCPQACLQAEAPAPAGGACAGGDGCPGWRATPAGSAGCPHRPRGGCAARQSQPASRPAILSPALAAGLLGSMPFSQQSRPFIFVQRLNLSGGVLPGLPPELAALRSLSALTLSSCRCVDDDTGLAGMVSAALMQKEWTWTTPQRRHTCSTAHMQPRLSSVSDLPPLTTSLPACSWHRWRP